MAASCSRENSNEFVPYPGHEQNDTNWYTTVPQAARVRALDSIFAVKEIEDSIDVTSGGTLQLGDSIRITFPSGFCVTTAAKVLVSVKLLDSKGDMIREDRPTMSYDRLLVTGGAMHISVTFNSQQLQLAPGKKIKLFIVSRMSQNSPSPDMKVFYGKEDAYPVTATQQFTWVPSQDSMINSVAIRQDTVTSLRGYEFFSTRFGWVNCDYFADTSLPRTRASVVLPPNFTNANTNVYAVVKSPDIVAQLLPHAATKTFVIPNIYVGKTVTFVSLSFIDGKLLLAYREVIITSNMIINLHPEQKTKTEIQVFLNNL